MKISLFAKGNRRNRIFTAITAAAVVVLIGLNLWLTSFGIFGTAFFDMTPEGLYTLSDRMKKECSFLSELKDEDGKLREIEMIFCNDPDRLIASEETRVVYYSALALHKAYPNFKVKTVNVSLDPTQVASYRTTSLSTISPTDVILTYRGKYRVVPTSSFWYTMNDGTHYSYNGEYKLASLLLSLTAYETPIAYFVTDHGTTYYDPQDPTSEMSKSCSSFADLLTEQGLTVRTLSLSDPDIEEKLDECALLIINNPTEDFATDTANDRKLGYISETERIERYLIKNAGSVMVTKDFRLTLGNLEDLLSEWGIRFTTEMAKDEENAIGDGSGAASDGTRISAQYNADKEGYGYAIYGEYTALGTSPKCVISDTGAVECSFDDASGIYESGSLNTHVQYSAFLQTGIDGNLYAKNTDGSYTLLSEKAENSAVDLCAVSGRMAMDDTNGNYRYSYVFAGASADLFSNDLLGRASYANYEVFSALVNNFVRSDRYADDGLGGSSFNSDAFGGKRLVDTALHAEDETFDATGVKPITKGNKTALTVVLVLVPFALAAVGAFIAIRRRYL